MRDPRPSWEQWGMDLAKVVATRADCTRRQVGAVIMDTGHRIVSTGYNGAPPGHQGCLTEGACPRGRASAEEVPPFDAPGASSYDIGPGSCIALHAEQNAIIRASHADMVGATLYVTCEPCPGCMRMIKGTPMKKVFYPNFRNPDFFDMEVFL